MPSFFLLASALLSILLSHSCHAQNSKQDYLDAHNTARANVGVGPLTWDDQVTAYAKQYASQLATDCNLVYSQGQYGENLAAGSDDFMTATKAVAMWVNEKQYYHHDSNKCDEGQVCGHYTQVVWRNSVRLGCARVQ
ncbi:pathogenesis-related protein 1C-like [Solanum dulcamara]|uniref:pathogenesis-related protein 1C-like n=1 Tax=Solanum dulcamara TaxID=45834 RepID=UPI002486C07F|nr:pathogenesis-related protein 1C-like [Solanum dulcamara]